MDFKDIKKDMNETLIVSFNLCLFKNTYNILQLIKSV